MNKSFTQEEWEILQRFKEEKNKPSISVALSLKMFELYLNGSTCEEIVKVNNNQCVGSDLGSKRS